MRTHPALLALRMTSPNIGKISSHRLQVEPISQCTTYKNSTQFNCFLWNLDRGHLFNYYKVVWPQGTCPNYCWKVTVIVGGGGVSWLDYKQCVRWLFFSICIVSFTYEVGGRGVYSSKNHTVTIELDFTHLCFASLVTVQSVWKPPLLLSIPV